jgi:hypothetical protein
LVNHAQIFNQDGNWRNGKDRKALKMNKRMTAKASLCAGL